MSLRYVIRPGWVRSRNDGDRHFIGAPQLMHLYGVQRSECVVIHQSEPIPRHFADLEVLKPRFDGIYTTRGDRP